IAHGRVKLIPEYERQLALQPPVAHLMERGQELSGIVKLRQVEGEGMDLARLHGFRNLLHAKRLAGPRRSKHPDGEWPGGLAIPNLPPHERLHGAEALDLTSVHGHEVVDPRHRHVAERLARPLQHDPPRHVAKRVRELDASDAPLAPS